MKTLNILKNDTRSRIRNIILHNPRITQNELESILHFHLDTCLSHRSINIIKDSLVIKVNKYRNYKISHTQRKINLHKARIIAHLTGDGWLRTNRSEIGYKNKNPFLINQFINDFKEVYGSNLEMYKNNRNGITEITSGISSIFNDLKRYGPFSSREWKIPKEILKSNNKIKIEFLKSIFDDEGCVDFRRDGKGYLCRRITMTLTNESALKNIHSLLKNFNINSRIYKKSKYDWFELYIGGQKNLTNFKNKVGFSHPNKEQKLNSLINSYND
jgi:hypothetical protein